MEKIKHKQTLQSLEYGILPCYGLICKNTQHFLTNMKKAVQMKHVNPSFFILSFFGEYPSDETDSDAKKDWEFFLCAEVEVFENFLQAYNSSDFKAIAEISRQNKDIAFVLPLLLKNYELIRSGKKNVFAIQIAQDQKQWYGFRIERDVLAMISDEFKN